MSLSRGEWLRRVVHVGFGALALLLRWLSGWQAAVLAAAAFLFNWQVLPRLGGRFLWREAAHRRGYSAGILAYPLAVLALVVLFHDRLFIAAAGWGMVAAGDGTAALLGQALGRARLPWNERKSWVGSAAFVLSGTLAAAGLWAWTARLPLAPAAPHWPRTLALSAVLALGCAVVESLPLRLDDNITVPLAVALLFPPLLQEAHLLRRLAVGLALALVAVAAGRLYGSLRQRRGRA